MNDRSEAINILKQARDVLADRLTEMVLDSQEEIMDDALGECYMGGIDTLQERVGLRLVQVNQMLANLPPKADAPQYEETSELHPAQAVRSDEIDPTDMASLKAIEDASTVSLALPPPVASGPTFQTFVMLIQARNIESAGYQLETLLGVDSERAQACAAVFHDNFHNDAAFITKAMQLRGKLATGSINDSLMLLHECFGLRGIESIGVFQTLRAQLNTDQ